MIKTIIINLKKKSVIRHVERMGFPEFKDRCNIVRKHIIFSGKVQRVGFRIELYCIADLLGLTGYVSNCKNGDVQAEMQGESARIEYLIKVMNSIKRIKIINIISKEISIIHNEIEFKIK
jgi:acylphosphatase